MKKLIVLALCLFSVFVIVQTTVQAVTCPSGLHVKELKECEGFSNIGRPDIFDHLLFINNIVLFVCGCLFIFGAYNLSTKKEMSKKEKTIASLFAYSPLLPFLFFFIIKLIQNLM